MYRITDGTTTTYATLADALKAAEAEYGQRKAREARQPAYGRPAVWVGVKEGDRPGFVARVGQ